jgi:hypothetical protein
VRPGVPQRHLGGTGPGDRHRPDHRPDLAQRGLDHVEPAVVGQRQQVHPPQLVVEHHRAVGEHQCRVRVLGPVRERAAALGLQLVPEVADPAERELERQVGRAHGVRRQVPVQPVEERPVVHGDAVRAGHGHGHLAGEHVERRDPRQRPARVPHHGEPAARAAVQPERVRRRAVEPRERRLRVGVQVQRPHHDLPRWRHGSGADDHDRRNGRDRVVLLGQAAEVRQQPEPVVGADRLGVELHAPRGPRPVPHGHEHAVVRPGHRFQFRRQVGDRERVVPHHPQRRRQPVEQVHAGVPDEVDATVPRFRREPDGGAVFQAQPLMTEAHSEERNARTRYYVLAEAEIDPISRVARSG